MDIDIKIAVRVLENERINKKNELIQQWEQEYYYPKLKELRSKCKHNWLFESTNSFWQ